jgi:hypothetical protein
MFIQNFGGKGDDDQAQRRGRHDQQRKWRHTYSLVALVSENHNIFDFTEVAIIFSLFSIIHRSRWPGQFPVTDKGGRIT